MREKKVPGMGTIQQRIAKNPLSPAVLQSGSSIIHF